MLCRCSLPHYTESRTWNGRGYAGRAGLYRVLPAVRWKTIDGIPAAMDADTGEETVIWTAYPFADSVSVLGPAQVLHDKQAVPLRISGGEWGSGEPSAGV